MFKIIPQNDTKKLQFLDYPSISKGPPPTLLCMGLSVLNYWLRIVQQRIELRAVGCREVPSACPNQPVD